MSNAKELLAYRRAHFAAIVECKHDRELSLDKIVLRITTNGTQWESLLLLPEEVPQVIKALREGLRDSKALTKK